MIWGKSAQFRAFENCILGGMESLVSPKICWICFLIHSRDFGQFNLLAWAGLNHFCSLEMSLKLACQIFLLVSYPRIPVYFDQGWSAILKRKFVERKEFYFDLNVKFNFSSLSLRWAVLLWPGTFDNIPLHCRPLFYQISQGIKKIFVCITSKWCSWGRSCGDPSLSYPLHGQFCFFAFN